MAKENNFYSVLKYKDMQFFEMGKADQFFKV